MDKKELLIYGGILATGIGIGFGTGYLVSKKKYQSIAENEIESVRLAYSKNATPKPDILDLVRDKVVVTPDETTDQEHLISSEGYAEESEETDATIFRRVNGRVPTTDELIEMGNMSHRNAEDDSTVNFVEGNVFDSPQPDPEETGPGEEEISTRDKTRPYIISIGEWHANETDYDQVTLTYWADDDVLADDNSRMITDINEVVGALSLHRFGTMSEDADIVYVRNDRLRADYEITKDERNYSEVVHGITTDEVNNSSVPRRMRGNDD